MDTENIKHTKRTGKRSIKARNRVKIMQRWEKAEIVTPGPSTSASTNISVTTHASSSASGSVIDDGEQLESITQASPMSVASKRKLSLMQREASTDLSLSSHEWCIIELGQMNKILSSALCPGCFNNTLLINKGGVESCKGFAEQLYLQCSNSHCNFSSDKEYSSPKIMDVPSNPFAINSLMTMYCSDIGKGNLSLQKLKQFFGFSTMSSQTFKKHQSKLQEISTNTTSSMLYHAAEKIKEANADAKNGNITDITVSYDGTWQRRGFSSKHGVGVAIEVHTGLVIDFEVLSTHCHACKLAEKRLGSQSAALLEWKKNHNDCSKNYEGSSKSMEVEAARRIWQRSIEKYGLRYTSILSDGDASTFVALQTLNPYGDQCPIQKLDCINHADKRFGKAIKEKKLGGRGTGRLTENKAKLLQSYYGRAIRSNTGDAESMRKAIWANLFHSMSTDESPLHQNCPEGPESWCKYKKALALSLPAPKHGPTFCRTFLSPEVGNQLKNIYERMTENNLLERMLTGSTQNANESCNNLIWVHCPKNMFVSLSTLKNAVETAVLKFNAGASTTTERIKQLGIAPSDIQIACMHKADRKRIKKAETNADDKIKKARKDRQQGDKRSLVALERAEGLQYGAGKF